MEIISRVGKYRSNGSWYTRNSSSITTITVHHTAMEQNKYGADDNILKTIQIAHQSRGWPGLSYHFVITPNGNIYQINELTEITWHDGINNDSIGIVLQGYFHGPYNEKPTDEQLKSLRTLLDNLCSKHPEFPADYNDVYGHRERTSTACPGDNLIGYITDYRNKNGNVSWGIIGGDQSEDYRKTIEELIEEKNLIKSQLKQTKYELGVVSNKLQETQKKLTDTEAILSKNEQELAKCLKTKQPNTPITNPQTPGFLKLIENLGSWVNNLFSSK